MFVPSSVEEIDQMIKDRVQESIHLDYKDSRAIDPNKRDEIAKDVSSFANSDGGVIVYGVQEEKGTGFPLQRDGGIDQRQFSKERLEQIIIGNVTPRLDFRLEALPLDTGNVIFVVRVAKSFSGPHQASDEKYYKRYNFMAVPMEDYEITDVRNRPKRVPPLITFDADTYGKTLAVFEVANVGEVAAEDVQFSFSTTLPWREEVPYALKNGIRRMPPRQTFRFLYHPLPDIFDADNEIPAEFSVVVSYLHPDIQTRQSFEWHVNLNAFRGSLVVRSDEEAHRDKILEQLNDLNKTLKTLCSFFERG